MNRDRASTLDTLIAARQIAAFTAGQTKASLENNAEKQSAILYQIVIIGEAAKRLFPEFWNRRRDIKWRGTAGRRDILVHQYDCVDLDTLWSVIQNDILELIERIEVIASDWDAQAAIARNRNATAATRNLVISGTEPAIAASQTGANPEPTSSTPVPDTIEIPLDLARSQLPAAVSARLQLLLDRQNAGDPTHATRASGKISIASPKE